MVRGRLPGLRQAGPLPGVLEVRCGDRRAVLELHVRPQVEGIDGASGGDGPFCSDIRRRLQVLVQLHQPAENLEDVAVGGGIAGDGRVQRVRVDVVQVQRAAG